MKIGDSMQEDLKIIKNIFGEKMMHLCRELFPTILEHPGVLSKILLDHFEPSKSLYEDIVDNKVIPENQTSYNHQVLGFRHISRVNEFRDFIYDLCNTSVVPIENKADKTPSELLDEAGYILYECKTEADIQQFRKYYEKKEEICTFKGGRLNRCHVFFAVRKDVDEIRREDFPNPERQDRYGTSVISIQFTKDSSHVLSIKNRYNHIVANPDATFSNNLDSIIPGLTSSFSEHYGLKQQFNKKFELGGYVLANDGKYYKYNYEINNIYYCPNNIIIDNFEVKKYPEEDYIVVDYFVLNLKTGEFEMCDDSIDDDFKTGLDGMYKISISSEGGVKKINFKDGDDIAAVVTLNERNQIIGYENLRLTKVGDDFLKYNHLLEKINLPEVISIGHSFLDKNEMLTSIEFPKLETVLDCFMNFNTQKLVSVRMPKLKDAGKRFLTNNISIEDIFFPELFSVGSQFLKSCDNLKEVIFPKLKYIDRYFLSRNTSITKLYLPEVEEIGEDFLADNMRVIKHLYMPKLKCVYRTGNEPINSNVKMAAKLEKIIAKNTRRDAKEQARIAKHAKR